MHGYWERSLRRVTTVADGFQTCVMGPGLLRAMNDEVTAHLVDVGRDPAGFPVFSEEMTCWWTAAGPPDACVEQLQDLIDQGATEITLRCASFDQASQFDRLVNEVLPALR